MNDFYQLPANLKPAADLDARQAKIAAAEAVKRKATLKVLGIKTLDPYGSDMMKADVIPKERGSGKGNWRDGPRQVARRNGLTRYWGRLCKASHRSPRYMCPRASVSNVWLSGGAGRPRARAQAGIDKSLPFCSTVPAESFYVILA